MDNVYWTFSAAAQAISALFAFLLAGFALVQAMMENAQQRDDTITEVHARLQRDHYRGVVVLSIVAGVAILLSLAVVYGNPWLQAGRRSLAALVAAVDAAAIAGAILFVIWIVNPRRYEATARRLVRQRERELGLHPPSVDARDFFQVFVAIEQTLRAILRKQGLYEPGVAAGRIFYPFRSMVDALQRSELISSELYSDLLQVNRYRNLVFHGHEPTVSEEVIQRARALLEELRKILSRRRRQN